MGVLDDKGVSYAEFSHEGIVAESERAVLVDVGDGREEWISKSQLNYWDVDTMEIPHWLARKLKLD